MAKNDDIYLYNNNETYCDRSVHHRKLKRVQSFKVKNIKEYERKLEYNSKTILNNESMADFLNNSQYEVPVDQQECNTSQDNSLNVSSTSDLANHSLDSSLDKNILTDQFRNRGFAYPSKYNTDLQLPSDDSRQYSSDQVQHSRNTYQQNESNQQYTNFNSSHSNAVDGLPINTNGQFRQINNLVGQTEGDSNNSLTVPQRHFEHDDGYESPGTFSSDITSSTSGNMYLNASNNSINDYGNLENLPRDEPAQVYDNNVSQRPETLPGLDCYYIKQQQLDVTDDYRKQDGLHMYYQKQDGYHSIHSDDDKTYCPQQNNDRHKVIQDNNVQNGNNDLIHQAECYNQQSQYIFDNNKTQNSYSGHVKTHLGYVDTTRIPSFKFMNSCLRKGRLNDDSSPLKTNQSDQANMSLKNKVAEKKYSIEDRIRSIVIDDKTDTDQCISTDSIDKPNHLKTDAAHRMLIHNEKVIYKNQHSHDLAIGIDTKKEENQFLERDIFNKKQLDSIITNGDSHSFKQGKHFSVDSNVATDNSDSLYVKYSNHDLSNIRPEAMVTGNNTDYMQDNTKNMPNGRYRGLNYSSENSGKHPSAYIDNANCANINTPVLDVIACTCDKKCTPAQLTKKEQVYNSDYCDPIFPNRVSSIDQHLNNVSYVPHGPCNNSESNKINYNGELVGKHEIMTSYSNDTCDNNYDDTNKAYSDSYTDIASSPNNAMTKSSNLSCFYNINYYNSPDRRDIITDHRGNIFHSENIDRMESLNNQLESYTNTLSPGVLATGNANDFSFSGSKVDNANEMFNNTIERTVSEQPLSNYTFYLPLKINQANLVNDFHPREGSPPDDDGVSPNKGLYLQKGNFSMSLPNISENSPSNQTNILPSKKVHFKLDLHGNTEHTTHYINKDTGSPIDVLGCTSHSNTVTNNSMNSSGNYNSSFDDQFPVMPHPVRAKLVISQTCTLPVNSVLSNDSTYLHGDMIKHHGNQQINLSNNLNQDKFSSKNSLTTNTDSGYGGGQLIYSQKVDLTDHQFKIPKQKQENNYNYNHYNIPADISSNSDNHSIPNQLDHISRPLFKPNHVQGKSGNDEYVLLGDLKNNDNTKPRNISNLYPDNNVNWGLMTDNNYDVRNLDYDIKNNAHDSHYRSKNDVGYDIVSHVNNRKLQQQSHNSETKNIMVESNELHSNKELCSNSPLDPLAQIKTSVSDTNIKEWLKLSSNTYKYNALFYNPTDNLMSKRNDGVSMIACGSDSGSDVRDSVGESVTVMSTKERLCELRKAKGPVYASTSEIYQLLAANRGNPLALRSPYYKHFAESSL